MAQAGATLNSRGVTPAQKRKGSIHYYLFSDPSAAVQYVDHNITTIVYQFRAGIVPAHMPQNTEFTGCRY